MKIDVYNNNKSVKPTTSWKSLADMFNFLEENSEIKKVCDEIARTGDKSKKDKLPAMMPMGTVGDLTRSKENATPTGLVMIDMDGKDLLVKGEMEKWVEAQKAELERLYVRLVHITPSGRGLRLLVCCHADGMEETIERCVRDLKLDSFGKVDPACKDLSRLSYLVPAEYILYTDKLFDEVPDISLQMMKQYKVTGTTEKFSNEKTQVGEIFANDEHLKDFKYNDFPLAQIVKDYIAGTGGDPVEGTRHTFYNEMVVMFRNLANNDPKILHAVLPTFGLPIEETWKQCVSLTSSNRQIKLDSRLYFWLKNKGLLAERNRMENEEEAKAEPMPPMPALPPIFRQYVNAAPRGLQSPHCHCPSSNSGHSHLPSPIHLL